MNCITLVGVLAVSWGGEGGGLDASAVGCGAAEALGAGVGVPAVEGDADGVEPTLEVEVGF